MNPTLLHPSQRPDTGTALPGADAPEFSPQDTSRFGVVAIAADSVLHFPEGLIGLGGSRYALISSDPASPFLWLQSLDDAALALPVANPHRFFTDFAVELDAEDVALVGIEGDEPVDVLVTVTASPERVTANLKAPILIRGNTAYQIINRAAGAQVKTPLLPAA